MYVLGVTRRRHDNDEPLYTRIEGLHPFWPFGASTAKNHGDMKCRRRNDIRRVYIYLYIPFLELRRQKCVEAIFAHASALIIRRDAFLNVRRPHIFANFWRGRGLATIHVHLHLFGSHFVRFVDSTDLPSGFEKYSIYVILSFLLVYCIQAPR